MAASSTEVNDLLVRLSACAHSVRGPVGDELMHLVSRLTNAVTRERTAGYSELQSLRRKILQQPDVRRRPEMPHRQTLPVNNTANIPKQTAMVPNANYGHFSQDRLNAVIRGPPSSPARKPDFPDTQPTASNAVPVAPRGQRHDAIPPPMQHEHQNNDARGWLLTDSTATRTRKRSSSVTTDVPAKKFKATTQSQSSALTQKGPTRVKAGFYPHVSPACVRCIVGGQRCNGERHCGNCKLIDCIYLKCDKAECGIQSCPCVHNGQLRSPDGYPICRILDVNVRRLVLSPTTRTLIDRALDKVLQLGRSSEASQALTSLEQRQLVNIAAASASVPSPSAASGPKVDSGTKQTQSNGSAHGQGRSMSQPHTKAVQEQMLTTEAARPLGQNVDWQARFNTLFDGSAASVHTTQSNTGALQQASAVASETRDPRLAARSLAQSSRMNQTYHASPVQSFRSQAEPAAGSSRQMTSASAQPPGVAMEVDAKPTAAFISGPTFRTVSRPEAASKDNGKFGVASQTLAHAPLASLTEQQRSIEELLQSLMPIDNYFGIASEQATPTATRRPNVAGSPTRSTVAAASFTEAVPALQAASLTSHGAVNVGGDDGGLEDGEIEEPKTTQELKAEQSEVVIKVEVVE